MSGSPLVRSLTIFSALSACLVLAGCGGKAARRTPSVPVSVARVESRAVPHEIEATGTVEPQQTVEILAQVGGTVEKIGFREGDRVRDGQLLFQLDARPFQAALDQARAVLARDRAQSAKARREADRARTLKDRGLISAVEYEDKQAASEALAAGVRADSAAATQASLNLQHTRIRAPIAGRTGRLSVHVGDVVKPSDSASPLVTINQMHPVRVRFTVPQDVLPAVLRGRDRRLQIRVSPADRDTFGHQGWLVFVDNAVDPATGTLMLKGELDNEDEALWPGEFVRVRLVLAADPNAIVVPAAAVTAGPSGSFVYVVGSDSTVAIRPVVVQRSGEEIAVIARGLEPGEIVVTDGQLRLGPGARVVVRPSASGEKEPGLGGAGTDAAPAAKTPRGSAK